MIIIGCDFHTRFQQIAMLDTETGELTSRRLQHQEEARQFYAAWPPGARVGMEATGYARWFEEMLAEYKHELWIGHAAEIRARMVRKQKNDDRDAEHILDLLVTGRFPRIWRAKLGERDVWNLLRHRDKLVRMRTMVVNQLHALAMGEGLCRKKSLWTQAAGRQQLEALRLGPWAERRRKDLLEMLDGLGPAIAELDDAVQKQAAQQPAAVVLMQQPGVGPVTALAFALMVGEVQRFRRSRDLVSYVGLNPSEDSSAGKQRLGHISKQGNTLVRWLLVQAAQTASRSDAELRRAYRRLVFRRGKPVAKVAIARKLAVKLYWKLRQHAAAAAANSPAGQPEVATDTATVSMP